MGTVYLWHFTQRYKYAAHYLGFASNLRKRLAAHDRGQGARLLEVVKAAGISWQLARIWEGGREQERKLKKQKNSVRLCPLCKGLKPETGVSHQASRRSPRTNAR
jgi:predicted GIY-YIG superfamily endonuclease